MSAVLRPRWSIRPMHPSDVEAVADIDRLAYDFPWSEGIFHDCLRVGYSSWVASDAHGVIHGYALMTMAAGEAHILNVCVDPTWQRSGCGQALVAHLLEIAIAAELTGVFLEVRPSNRAARGLYADFGFDEIGRRKGYYPAAGGREDAIVLAWSPESVRRSPGSDQPA